MRGSKAQTSSPMITRSIRTKYAVAFVGLRKRRYFFGRLQREGDSHRDSQSDSHSSRSSWRSWSSKDVSLMGVAIRRQYWHCIDSAMVDLRCAR